MQYSFEYLNNEARSLLARLNQVKPFSMTMPMVKGASIGKAAYKEVIALLEREKSVLRKGINKFIEDLKEAERLKIDERHFQSRFTVLKIRFNNILDQLDIFADVLSQRGEYDVGIWAAGLDVLAEDGLKVLEPFTEIPNLMVYLDRGHGAAIRRARTRLPGGVQNPVAIIQVPRERMVGSGIASSLIHEVGHQAAALLDLVPSLSTVLAKKATSSPDKLAWEYYNRCISEIVSDVWAMGHLGISATLGLMGVVTLPRYFQFRLNAVDPHPTPYIRVQLSCAFGKQLYPHEQWDTLWEMWTRFYPKQGLDAASVRIISTIEKQIDPFVDLVIHHTTGKMQAKKLYELFPLQKREPRKLQALYQLWRSKKLQLQSMPPTLVFALFGQAKFDLAIGAEEESQVLTQQLRRWAFERN